MIIQTQFPFGGKSDVPVRIQRKIKFGFNLKDISDKINGLPNIYVGRGSTWGNPFRIVKFSNGEYGIKTDDSKQCTDILVKNCLPIYKKKEDAVMDSIMCYDYYLLPYRHGESLMKFYQSMAEMDEIILKLKGKNLVCWCPIHENNMYHHCHADLLLSLANKIPLKDVIDRNIITFK
jgi:hypothetical protein